jgi:hypothetical protein
MVTTRSLGANPSRAEQYARAQEGASAGAAPPTAIPLSDDRIGVVFVHGIGSQKQGETLLQWSAPLIEVMTAWRLRARAGGLLPDDQGALDPVVTAELDYETPLPVVTVRVPAVTIGKDKEAKDHPEQRWLMTEAWWASKVEPPGLGTMTSWLGPRGGTGQIVEGILANPSGNPGGLVGLARRMVLPFVTVFAAVLLTGVVLLRGISRLIPIDAIRDSAILRIFDGFLTGWFGDVRILLFDPVQSANIRLGLVRAIDALTGLGCGRIVLVAHSGGAMVSALTLTDPQHADARVDKLITLGEGWNLALRLAPKAKEGAPMAGMSDRLRKGMWEIREDLRWADYWASNDPAAAGRLLVDQLDPSPRADQVVSSRVWNRRSLLDDHGTYWDNDEEFIIPVLRQIDDPTGDGTASRFYPPDSVADGGAAAAAPQPAASAASPLDAPEEPGPRAARHRQRVAALAVWRQACIVLGVSAITVALALTPDRLVSIGQRTADALLLIPGVKLLEGPLGWLRTLELGVLPGTTVEIVPILVWLGVAVLQAVVLMSILQLLFAPVRAFEAWPGNPRMRGAVIVAEVILGLVLIAAAATVFWPPTHHKLLGAGIQDWLGGILVTVAILLLAAIGSEASRLWNSPVTTIVFGGVASGLFVLCLFASVVAIFKRPGIELAELAYATIWIGFVIVYRIGLWFWRFWDRRERHLAYGLVGHIKVNRWPAIVGAVGLVLLALAVAMFALGLPLQLPIGLSLAAGAIAGETLYLAGRASEGIADGVSAPGPVMSGRSEY